MSNRRIQKSSSQRSAGVQMHVARWSLAAALVASLCLTASIAVGNTVNPFDAPETPASESVDARGVVDSLRQNDLAAAQEGANKLIKSDPKNPVGYNMLGGVQAGRRDYAAARKSFEQALALDRDYSPASMNLAQLDMLQKDYATARRRYDAVLAKEPTNVSAMLGLSRIEFIGNNSQDGVRWLERAKTTDPAAWMPRLLLVRHRLATGDLQAAISELTDARRKQPDNPAVLAMLGQVQLARGQNADAVASYQQWVKLQPESSAAHANLGLAMEAAGDLPGANEHISRAIALNPDNPDAIYAQGTLELRNGRTTQALELARRLEKRAPKSTVGFTLEGDALTAQKQYAAAVLAYENALKIASTGSIIQRLHHAQSSAGDTQNADERVLQWVKANPQDAATRQYLAGEYVRRGRVDLAIPQYEAVIERQPQNVVALNNLALIYLNQKNVRGLELAQSAYNLRSESPGVIDTYGWGLVQFGNAPRGLELIQKAAKLAPTNSEIRLHLAAALIKTGKKDEARAELQQLLAKASEPQLRQSAEALLKKVQ